MCIYLPTEHSSIVPNIFYQLYTIHAFKNGQCVVFFLPDKTEETYRNMFQHLIECCTDLQLILNISCLHLDFEHATHNAARAIWPEIDIKGCQFHLSQSCWRKVQSLGLAAEYKNPESNVGNWIKSFFGLSYLDPNDVEDCFAFDLFPCALNVEKAHEFADYILRNYIDQNSKFPPSVWAEPDLQFKRTTNGCESFHAKFADMFYHSHPLKLNSHPPIFEFMERLKSVQTHSYLKIRASRHSVPSARKERECLEKMREIRSQYEQGNIDRANFVRKMAFKALPPII